MRRAIRTLEREIQMLKRAVIPTVSAELLLTRMRAKVDDLCREREVLRQAQAPRERATADHFSGGLSGPSTHLRATKLRMGSSQS